MASGDRAIPFSFQGAHMTKKHVTYATTQPSPVLFDMLIQGENLRGVWLDNSTKKTVIFRVPSNLSEAFERHYHFLSGNVARHVDQAEPINTYKPQPQD
jgi:hypothetical protein